MATQLDELAWVLVFGFLRKADFISVALSTKFLYFVSTRSVLHDVVSCPSETLLLFRPYLTNVVLHDAVQLECLPPWICSLSLALVTHTFADVSSCLPPELRKLSMYFDNRSQVRMSAGMFPPRLEELRIFTGKVTIFIDGLPNSLQTLELRGEMQHGGLKSLLPRSLRTLVIVSETFTVTLAEGNLPDALEVLRLDVVFSRSFGRNVLPTSLKELVLSGSFNHQLEVGALPPALERLVFGPNYDQPLLPGTLPLTLHSLVLGVNYNQSLLPGVLHDGIEEFPLPVCFNQPLAVGSLPSNWKSLIFGRQFNQRIVPHSLPSLLEKVEFSQAFNQPLVHHTFPCSLRHIVFGADFNQPVAPAVFPEGVHSITFGECFTQHVPASCFPSCLTTLRFHCCRDRSLNEHSLPRNLRHLLLRRLSLVHTPVILNPMLNVLDIDCHEGPNLHFVVLPASLEKLFLRSFQHHIPAGWLPYSLRFLFMSGDFVDPFSPGCLPSSIEIVELDSPRFMQTRCLSFLPQSVRELNIWQMSPEMELRPWSLPCRLQWLCLGFPYTHIFRPGVLPPALLTLRMTASGKQTLTEGSLPEGLQELWIDPSNEPFQSKGLLPSTLRRLHLSDVPSKPISTGVLPGGLEDIYVLAHVSFRQCFEPGAVGPHVRVHLVNDDHFLFDSLRNQTVFHM